MATPNLNVCKYRPVRICDEYGINARFNLLFQEVCTLKNTSGSGGGLKLAPITSADFEPDGVTYLNSDIDSGTNNTSIFWDDVNRFIFKNQGEWKYVTGGIEILISGFDANINSYNLEIFMK